jgi:hypothetical protein
MPRKVVFSIVLALSLSSFRAFASDGRNVCPTDVLHYDTKMETHFEGKVTAINNFRGVSILNPCTFITISNAGVRSVFFLGPRDFIARNEFKLAVGDMVSITGAPATDFRKRSIILTRLIRNNSMLLTLRDEAGDVLWMKPPVEMDPELGNDYLKECRLPNNREMIAIDR